MDKFKELAAIKAQFDRALEACRPSVKEMVEDINSRLELLKSFGAIKSDMDDTYHFDRFIVNEDGSIYYEESDE